LIPAPPSGPAPPLLSATPAPGPAGVIAHPPTRLQRFLGWIAATLLRALAATLRYRIHGGYDTPGFPEGPVIFALWHNRLCLCMRVFEHIVPPRDRRLAALISASRDGAFLAAILQHFGVQPVRGSSSRRGGQALLELHSWAGRGYNIAITPDGPRGPCYRVHDGILSLAQVTGLPIIPYSCQLRWKIRLKSWDRFQIPLPFSRCEMTFGAPILVPRDSTPADRERLAAQLRDILLAGAAGD